MTKQEEFIKRYKKLKASGTLKASLICPHCEKFFSIKVSRRNEDHEIWDEKNKEFKRKICKGEKEYYLAQYYDSTIAKIPNSKVPEKTPLSSLVNADKTIESAFLVGGYRDFCLHLKAFVRDTVWNKKLSSFSYSMVNYPELKDYKFTSGSAPSFDIYDQTPLLILDLYQETLTTKIDNDYLKEFVYSRENKFLPLWILSPTAKITNKNLDDDKLRKHIVANYPKTDIPAFKKSESSAGTEVDVKESPPVRGEKNGDAIRDLINAKKK